MTRIPEWAALVTAIASLAWSIGNCIHMKRRYVRKDDAKGL